MSRVQAVQLLARGPQDVWLSGDPQVSFYRSTYRRHEPFAMTTETQSVPRDGKVRLVRKGDLLGYMYLTVHDPDTGYIVPGLTWTSLLDRVELVIGNQIVVTHDTVYLTQIRPTLEAKNLSQRSSTSFLPLGFFTDQTPLPLSAMKYTDIDIVLAGQSQSYGYKLWTQQIHLGDAERNWFSTTPHKMLLTQVQRLPVTTEPSFRGPIKYLAWPTLNYNDLYSSIKWNVKFSGGNVGFSSLGAYDGNVYVVGGYSGGAVTFYNPDGSAFGTTLPQIGNQAAYIAKYDTNGRVQWCAYAGSPAENFNVHDVQVDSTGVYVAGIFRGTATFYNSDGASSGQTLTTIVAGGENGYIARYTHAGALEWCTRFGLTGSTSYTRSWSIKLDASGVYVSSVIGSFNPARFYNSDGSLSVNSDTTLINAGALLCKYTKSGFLVWRVSPTRGTNYGLAVTPMCVYITSEANVSPMNFYNSDDTLTPGRTLTSLPFMFIAGYNPTTGMCDWCTRITSGAGAFTRTASSDSAGNVYVVGIGNSLTEFYNSDGSKASASISASGSYGLVASYDSSGFFRWAARITADRINSVACYDDRVYVSGMFSGTQCLPYNADGTPFSKILTRRSTTRDTYIAAYTNTGKVLWIAQGASSINSAMGRIDADSSGVYFTGQFTGGPMRIYGTLGQKSTTDLTQLGTQSGFVAKLSL